MIDASYSDSRSVSGSCSGSIVGVVAVTKVVIVTVVKW